MELTNKTRVKILTTVDIKQEWLDEIVENIPGIEFDITPTKEKLEVYYNTTQKSNYAIWDTFKKLFGNTTGYRYRVYVMSEKERKAYGMTSHYAAYNNVDRDGVFDFYMSIGDNTKFTREKDKLNGFKTVFARRFIHEMLHGAEQNIGREYLSWGSPDRVHSWEEEGRLKELLLLHVPKEESILGKINYFKSVYQYIVARFRDPNSLQPKVKRLADLVVQRMAELGHEVHIFEGFRSKERQDELYAQGRTTPGKIVTNARGGESFHNYGVAVDIVFGKQGSPSWNNKHPWNILGDIGKSYGFEWGGEWKGLKDKPHFELALGYSISNFKNSKVDYTRYI